jgi:hypothetical protein
MKTSEYCTTEFSESSTSETLGDVISAHPHDSGLLLFSSLYQDYFDVVDSTVHYACSAAKLLALFRQ